MRSDFIPVYHQTARSLILLLLSLISFNAGAVETLAIGYVDFRPYEYSDDKGAATGSLIDITRQVAERAGYQPLFYPLPVSRLYLYLQEGKIDVWPGLAAIPALQGFVLESKAVPVKIQLNAWFLDSTPSITSIDSMKGHNLILISGYTYGGLLYKLSDPQSGFTLLSTRTTEAALQMLEKGRGDYLLDYSDPVHQALQGYPLAKLRNVPLNTRDGSFLVSRKAQHAELISRRLDEAYAALLKEGKIKFLHSN